MRTLLLCALLASCTAAADGAYSLMLDAIHANDLEMLEGLAKDSAYRVSVQVESWTPLHEAAYCSNVDAARVLLRHGANINARDGNGWTPLCVAVQKDYFLVADFLVTMGASGHVKDATGKRLYDYALGKDLKMTSVIARSFLNPIPVDPKAHRAKPNPLQRALSLSSIFRP